MKKLLTVLVAAAFVAGAVSDACTRLVYKGADGTVVIGRSMDWSHTEKPTLRILPRGAHCVADCPENPLEWTSRYGSVVAVSAGRLFAGGVNEAGLGADVLYLAASDYGTLQPGEQAISTVSLVRFFLDCFATVDEAVDYMEGHAVRVVGVGGRDGVVVPLHYMLTDAGGDSAVFEFVDGELKIYHSPDLVAMANDPTYDKMLAIRDYYEARDLNLNCPGTSHSVDRFLRATAWLHQVADETCESYRAAVVGQDYWGQALMTTLSIIRSCSTPVGALAEENPENCTTTWRHLCDLTHRGFYWESALAPMYVWVGLDEIDFNGSERMLDLTEGDVRMGDVSHADDWRPVPTIPNGPSAAPLETGTAAE